MKIPGPPPSKPPMTSLPPGRRRNSDDVAANIRDMRKQLGWSRDELAENCRRVGAAFITRSVLENIEGGRPRDGQRTRHITIEELLAIANAMAVPAAALLPELGQGVGDMDVSLFDGIDDVIARMQLLKRRWDETVHARVEQDW